MNIANKLTAFRILLIPFLIFFLCSKKIFEHYLLWSLSIFCLACITDILDGIVARKNKLTTNFGKLFDPLADKMLIISTAICFVQLNFMHSVAVIIIVMREFLITSFRLMACNNNVIIAADIWGKLKTVLQMTYIILIMSLKELINSKIMNYNRSIDIFLTWFMWFIAAFTVISGANYILVNHNLIKSDYI